jgi:multiple sugar transport system substrate-binding protein
VPVTINVPSWWYGEPANKDWLIAAGKAFEETNPGIKVHGFDQPFPSYGDTILSQISAGNPPDVVHLLNLNMGDFLRIGALLPLDKYIGSSDINQNTYAPAQFQSPLTYKGHTYGVIQMVANYIPFYNKKLLKNAGYSQFPDNPQDFIAMVKKLSHPPDQYGYAAMVKPGNPVEMYLDVVEWVLANGGAFAKDGKPTLNDPKNIAAIQMFKDLYDAGVMPKGQDKSTYRKLWWEGKVAVLIDGSWMWGFAKSNNPSILNDLDTAPMPFPGHITAAAFQVWAIPKGAKHPDEAWKFIQFLQSADWQKKQVEITGAISPRIGATPPDYQQQNPWFKNFVTAVDVSNTPQGLETRTTEIQKIISDHVQEILYNNRPVADALNAAQKDVENLLSR